MREIKFRGKDINSGEWVYGDLHLLCDKPHIHTAASSYPFAGKRSFVSVQTIGQYIGLKDKNDKEIYEGDIVTMEDFGFTRERPFIVVYDNFDAGFKFRGVYCLVTPNCKCEVIGNIEDNPNLIPID